MHMNMAVAGWRKAPTKVPFGVLVGENLFDLPDLIDKNISLLKIYVA